jgi:diguanylate cyclase (GGDEF)-like protein/PAS domain S-box-containing protein
MGYATPRTTEDKLRAIWELAGDAMVFLDADGLLDCNDAALRLFGIDSRERAIGLPLHAFAPPTQADRRPSERVFAEGRRKVIESGAERFDWEFRHADGRTLVLDVILHTVQMGGGQVVHGIFRDVTMQRMAARELEVARLAAESSLRHLARKDALTGLPNRSAFLEEGQRRLDVGAQPDRICLLCVNVDNFRTVNEVLGEAVGDEALRALGERLHRFAGANDILARLGGDEFALLLTDCSVSEAAGVAARLITEQERPLTVGDQQFSVTVSVGVACPTIPAQSLESLMQQAAAAMNVSRQNGRGGWQLFAEAMNRGVLDRWRLESELRLALERQQFVVHYQPQIDLASDRIVGVEALVRWHNPRLGLVAPNRFITLAEAAGLIEPIGEWVLFEACRQNQRWLADGLTPVRMSVNVAARQFQRASLTDAVGRALGASRLAPEWLELEMTESTLMEGSSDTIGILSDLRNQGVSLAIDDFGTGYSSLAYLRRFPLDGLKLDQSFVRDIDCDPDGQAIVRAIINLGHTLRLKVIAEGVETNAQLDLLRKHRCDQAQGFHFARALPPSDMEVLLGRATIH